jgi:nucleoside-diphosphate-sugar epimerase
MRILLTGADGFTGKHFSSAALAAGHEVVPLTCDITNHSQVEEEILAARPTHVLHLAAISAVTHQDEMAFYQVNLFGTLNLLKALATLPYRLHSVMLASSGNVYGNAVESPIAETAVPKPVNHYAVSKIAMEYMAFNWLDRLPILIFRPFNYTGPGQSEAFVIPKIIRHFAAGTDVIELGNMDVEREFNDVRMVCDAQLRLLQKGIPGEVYNLCTGHTVSLSAIMRLLEKISGRSMRVEKNPKFMRKNEVYRLCGDPSKLEQCIGPLSFVNLEDTLRWMYESDLTR